MDQYQVNQQHMTNQTQNLSYEFQKSSEEQAKMQFLNEAKSENERISSENLHL